MGSKRMKESVSRDVMFDEESRLKYMDQTSNKIEDKQIDNYPTAREGFWLIARYRYTH